MKVNRIFIKVLALCVILIISSLGLQLGMQYFFLDNYYQTSLTTNVSNTLRELKTELEAKEMSRDERYTLIDNASYANSTLVQLQAVEDSYKDFEMLANSKALSSMIVEGTEGGEYNIILDGIGITSATEVMEGSNVIVKGYKDNIEGNIYPYGITVGTIDYSAGYTNSANAEVLNTFTNESSLDAFIEISGTIKSAKIYEPTAEVSTIGYEYQYSLLQDEINLVKFNNAMLTKLASNDSVITYQREDVYTGNSNLFFLTSVKLPDDKEYVLMAVSEVAPIQKLSGIALEFSVIVSTVGLMISLVIAYVISRGMTKPIIHINGITKKMASLDFNDKCVVKSNDEMQDLAEHINTMSDALEANISSLNNANEQLQDDIKAKEKLEVFRKQFIADASHELKTPITVIKGIGEGIVDGVYRSNDDEKIKELLEQTEHMQSVVYELLAVSRIESEEIDSRFSVFKFSEVIEAVLHRYQPFIKEKNIVVSRSLNDVFVNADEPLLEMVISNLINNAIKYTPANGSIKIATPVISQKISFVIENSPARIPDDELEQVWTAFYRIEKSRNREFGGTGLGLYTVKEILKKHQTTPWIRNTQEGVQVGFTLPLIEET